MPAPSRDSASSDLRRFRDSLENYYAKGNQELFDIVNAVVTLKSTANAFENFTNEYCKLCSLTPGRLGVLMTLNAHPDKTMPLSEIGECLIVTRPNITGLIDGLVEDGLVERIDDPEDRRVVLARLTPAGKKFMAWFVPEHFKNTRRLMSCLTGEEQRRLVVLLDKVRNHIRTLQIPKIEEPQGA